MPVDAFIDRWSASGGSEIANFQSFAIELTSLLEVEQPKPATSDGQNDDYRFERPVKETHTGKVRNRRIDLYRRGCFVLEAKQGANQPLHDATQMGLDLQDTPNRVGHGRRGTGGFDDTMLKARNQADSYARAVAKEDGWPPFLLIVDVGHVIEVYADFSKQGQGYNQFPDGNRYRIHLDDLRNPETITFLQTVWNDPFSLDPSLKAAEVTRDIATHLAELGKSFEGQGHQPKDVATFLMRCLFSMFAEDVDLIPNSCFTTKLRELRGHPEHAAPTLTSLWQTMDAGGFSPVLMQDLKKFNGYLFKDAEALPLNNLQLGLLIEAAEADWKQVEPAIFGTLLERALDKKQRHKLGAHYTPRAYVERLVTPTVIDPLRSDWRNVQSSVQLLMQEGKKQEAIETLRAFHTSLCHIKVLDPACGSGNFLYVALEMMKRLEGEVTALMHEVGDTKPMITVDPHQFLGIELNPWAAAVAELVLWIGYLQWHYRTYGNASPSEPVLRDFKNIQCRDAVLEWDDLKERLDENGVPVTRWDGVTTMRHQVTGEEVPDPTARIKVYDYINPRATTWPAADFIVGNPPFIGNKRMRDNLGDGYVEALWKAYPKMPASADLVMFWWEKAAQMARLYDPAKPLTTRRFGLITTNSLRQTFNRRVLEPHLNDPKKPLSLLFAIPDHPWVDTLYGAAVRIAMTVGDAGNRAGRLLTIATESKEKNEADGRLVTFDHQIGKIFANLQIGADVAGSKPLLANAKLAHQGLILVGEGFRLEEVDARAVLETDPSMERFLPRYQNGKQFIDGRILWRVIDFYGLSEADARSKAPQLFQILKDRVWPERSQNRDKQFRESWWLFGRQRPEFREGVTTLKRYIATCRTAKHRVFGFLGSDVLPDAKLIAIGLDAAEYLAVLSSSVHVKWALATGAFLEDRPNYNHAESFNKFPFPDLTDAQRIRLRTLGEELDAHRKRQQELHPKLTLTQMYNVLEKLRAGQSIEGKDKDIYDQGLIGILRDIHDKIDAAVAEAYGWPVDLSDEEILFSLVALNKKRAEEEARGLVRWLRPDYQNPEGKSSDTGKTGDMALEVEAKVEKVKWPKELPAQFAAVRQALEQIGEATPEELAACFSGAGLKKVAPLLETLVTLGHIEQHEERYAA
ncbi:MAG: class I SAM-dependent DNA methyltransferase [Flavobacteriaceae bacterium]|nr:class I SAM-dependent DNA methyltransferase [Flavobacteriaceae bacterium]